MLEKLHVNWGFRSSWMLERVTFVFSPMSLNFRPLKELLFTEAKNVEPKNTCVGKFVVRATAGIAHDDKYHQVPG